MHRGGRRARRAWAGALAAALLATAGCEVEGGGAGDTEDGRSPLTGQETGPGPVLAVKLDNVAQARPHAGLSDADLVYVEPVEGGLSRLLAVYSGSLPDRVGPVRSAREADLELLEQFDTPALAFSGAHPELLPEIADAPLSPVPPSDAPGAYERQPDRPAPHNLFLDPSAALDAAADARAPGDVGFRFGPAPEGGQSVAEETVGYHSAEIGFTWSEEADRWRVAFDGAPAQDADGAPVEAATVVVQEVRVRDSDLSDSQGTTSPYPESVGSGTARVLREGRAYQADWSRPTAGHGTEFTNADGERLEFADGPVWVVLTAA